MNRFEITASAPDKKAFSLLHYSKADGVPAKQGIALWACEDCKTEVVGNHAVLFSCPCCTSNMKAGRIAEMTAAELDKAHHVADCTFCGSTLVSASTATAQFKDKNLYCPVCSETVAVADDAAMPDMTSDKDAAKTDDTAGLGDDSEDESGNLPEGEDESDDDADESDDGADDEEDADDESEDDEENDETDNEDGSDEDDNTDGADKTATTSDDKSGSNDGNSGDGDGGDNSDGADDTSSEDDKADAGDDTDSADDKKDDTVAVGEGKDNTLDASLLAAMSGKDTDVNIVQSPDRNRWYLFADNAPVAVSEAGRCQENLRGVFATHQFATAFVAATEEGVTQDVLDEFGFEPVITKVTVDEAVRQSVEAQVKEKTEAHTMTAAAYGDRFQQCFGMAAAGMPKRFFKGDKNPVEKALVASLQKVGVRDAASIVANAFENHGKALYKTLVLRANDLMDKDDKTLEEVARLIDDREDGKSDPEENPKTPPVAALASMEDEAVKPPVAILASDSKDDDVFATYFQRKR